MVEFLRKGLGLNTATTNQTISTLPKKKTQIKPFIFDDKAKETVDGFDMMNGPDDWKTLYNKSQDEVKSLKAQVENLKRTVEDLTKEIEILQGIKSQNNQQARIQILYRNDGDHLHEVVEELSSLLYGTLCKHKLTLVHCKKESDVQLDIPLLVLCMNTSRLGVDIQVSLQDITDLRKTALLIFHHKDIHNLPVNPSEKALKGPKYQDLSCIVDFAFQKGKGIYKCDMNEQSRSNVIHFIEASTKQESVSDPSSFYNLF